MLIDCHTHLNRYDPTAPESLEARYHLLRAELERNAVDYALVLTSYKVNPDRPEVDEVLEVIGDDPRLGVVAGVSYYHHTAEELAHLRELIGAGRVRGLKLYPGYEAFELGEARMRPVYELAAESGIPVMIHTGDTFDARAKVRFAHPLALDEVAVEFREVRFVICHLGNPWFTDAMEVIYKNENVFGDISGLTLGEFQPRYERLARARVGEVVAYLNDPTKLLFGTDWPISDVPSYLRFVDGLELTREERAGLLGGNAARLFRLEGLGGPEVGGA